MGAVLGLTCTQVPVRMFFKNKDKGSYTNVSLTYDGLWDVVEYWREKGKSGFHVFKYRLKRQSGQPAYSFKTIAVGLYYVILLDHGYYLAVWSVATIVVTYCRDAISVQVQGAWQRHSSHIFRRFV